MAWDHSEPSFKPYQDDRQGTTVEAGDVEEQRRMKLLHSCVVDVWDKAYAVKVAACNVHTNHLSYTLH